MKSPIVNVKGVEPLRSDACRVIAEAGVNHNNSIDRAISMAEVAHQAGAWAIKFQLYKADTLASRKSPKYWSDTIGTTTQYEAFRLSDHLEYHEYKPIAQACKDLGIVFFATPFDSAAIEVLEELDVPLYKIASGDITHKQLLATVAETKKPVLLSTGAATYDEINRSIEWLGADPTRIVPLVCTLTYPTPDTDGNFARVRTFQETFSPFLIGVSDHTSGVAGGWLTSTLGGVCIEKHFTLDKSLDLVPDHSISIDPPELKELVMACNRARILVGEGLIGPRPSEIPARDNARRSIFANRAIPKGHVVEASDLIEKRPGTGIAPEFLESLIGKRSVKKIEVDTMLEWNDFE